ncbi:hypothetical protein LOAG_05204 [Loa loa]|uniref:Uncharacterized protein n=1 Tax=Loa loa TaxID=7209 RepID=A0A1S0U090_LOALO|nr:hypothetical protein LOAG_05204 [Loa loa]EFO23284.1 hypothetical protein LOAG_05204 [Loa loa]
MQEVLPDPFAERVIPKIDAMKEKYEQKKACEGRGRRRKLPAVKESKREGADMRKFFSQDGNGEQESQSEMKVKQRKTSKDDQSDENDIVEELSVHESSNDSVVALPSYEKKDTNKKNDIKKVRSVQRSVAAEGKKTTKKEAKRERVEKAKNKQSSPVMRMEDFFEPKVGKQDRQQECLNESDLETPDEAGPSGRKELPLRRRARINYNVDKDGDDDDSEEGKTEDVSPVVPKKKRTRKVIESDSDEDYEMQLNSD